MASVKEAISLAVLSLMKNNGILFTRLDFKKGVPLCNEVLRTLQNQIDCLLKA